ncbi:MAG: hypothetical protein OHK0029_08940 [Armatimonadaceae bacterium]
MSAKRFTDKRTVFRFALWILSATVGPLGMVTPPPASAQTGEAARQNLRTNQKPLATVLEAISRKAGVAIVADSSVGSRPVTPPAAATTPENFEMQVAELVQELPQGTTWAKLYLPEPQGRRGYNGDAVAAFALAQAQLFGNVGGNTAPGEIELLGQRVSSNTAPQYVQGLNLKPVYLITNPRLKTASNGMLADPQQWQAMSDDAKKAAVENAARQLANMDPQTRQQYMEQNFRIFGAMMRMLPPDQRQVQFFFPGGSGEATGAVRIITQPVPGSGP